MICPSGIIKTLVYYSTIPYQHRVPKWHPLCSFTLVAYLLSFWVKGQSSIIINKPLCQGQPLIDGAIWEAVSGSPGLKGWPGQADVQWVGLRGYFLHNVKWLAVFHGSGSQSANGVLMSLVSVCSLLNMAKHRTTGRETVGWYYWNSNNNTHTVFFIKMSPDCWISMPIIKSIMVLQGNFIKNTLTFLKVIHWKSSDVTYTTVQCIS